MDYQEPTHLAAYPPPPYHHQTQPQFLINPPHQNPSPNPNPSFEYQYHSSFHAVAAVPPPIEPIYPAVDNAVRYVSQAALPPIESIYPVVDNGVRYVSQAAPPPIEPIYPVVDNGVRYVSQAAPLPIESIYPVVDHGGIYTSQIAVHGGDYNFGSGRLPTHYHDPNWASNARFEDYARNPALYYDSSGNVLPTNVAQEFVTPSYNHDFVTNWKIPYRGQPRPRKTFKKIKIPQSFPCDVCKIVCDTEDVLKKHRLGKKHKLNLEKLKAEVAGPATATHNSATPAPEALNMSKSLNEHSKKRKVSQNGDDIETKKKKVLDGGAAMDAVRTCSICEVVVNSETVFQYHLAGQKHAAMVKKQALQSFQCPLPLP